MIFLSLLSVQDRKGVKMFPIHAIPNNAIYLSGVKRSSIIIALALKGVSLFWGGGGLGLFHSDHKLYLVKKKCM